MDISAQGQEVLTSFDVYDEAGKLCTSQEMATKCMSLSVTLYKGQQLYLSKGNRQVLPNQAHGCSSASQRHP